LLPAARGDAALHGPGERHLHRRDALEAARPLGARPGHECRGSGRGHASAFRGARADDGSPHRRRLGPFAARPIDGECARQPATRRLGRSNRRPGLTRLPGGGRSERNTGASAEQAARTRTRAREDGHDGRRVLAFRLRQRPLRVRSRAERPSAVVLVGPSRPGPVRTDTGRLLVRYVRFRSSTRSASDRVGTSTLRAFVSLELPGSSPTISPVVLPDTEFTTFAPFASSAAAASSRVKLSSVPVITYVLPVSGPSTGLSSSPISKRSPSDR